MELLARYTPISAEKSEAQASQLIAWCREYFRTRVNSRWIDERRCIPPHVVLDFGNRGVFGYHIDQAYGGMALRASDWVRVLAQLGALDPTVSKMVLINALATRTIASFGSQPLKMELLPLLAKGRMLAAFAQTEPGAGTNFMGMQSVAEPVDGGWRLTGDKIWIGNASWAGILSVIATTPGGALVALAVRPDTAGVRMGAELDSMGVRGVVQNAIRFDGVFVPAKDTIGGAAQGSEVAVDAMTFTRLGLAGQQLGCMKRCIQTMGRYARRRQIATGLLFDHAIGRALLSQAIIRLRLCEALVRRIADCVDRAVPVSLELAAAAKIVSTEFAGVVADRAVQLLGGRGYDESNFLPQVVRDLRVTRIFEGPTEALAGFLGKRLRHDLGARNFATLCDDQALTARLQAAVQRTIDRQAAVAPDPALSSEQWQDWRDYQLGLNGCWAFTAAAASGQSGQVATGVAARLLDAIEAGGVVSAVEDWFLPSDVILAELQAIDDEIGPCEQQLPGLNRAPDALLSVEG